MPMIPTFEMLSCRRQTIGPQCTAHDFVMTSSATEIVRALEQSWAQIDQLRAELATCRKLLDAVWHCMNDDNPTPFPMEEIDAARKGEGDR
jgi:hypothetical protein